MLFSLYYHAALFYLISSPSTSAPVALMVLGYFIRLLTIKKFGTDTKFCCCMPCLCSLRRGWGSSLDKEMGLRKGAEFWATILPNKFLLAASYQFTWESCWLLQTIGFWLLQCSWPSAQWGFQRKLSFSIYSLLLDKGKREAPAGYLLAEAHNLNSSWLVASLPLDHDSRPSSFSYPN